ncbi:MAG: rhodanese-like domain-containing protein [Gammaproteobacteria bacterium]
MLQLSQVTAYRVLVSTLLAVALLVLTEGRAMAQDEFPGRAEYPDVPVISTADLAAQYDDTIKIDVRSAFEYETLHMTKSANVPLGERQFVEYLREIRKATGNKPIAFYCNGKTCYKSYKAVRKVAKAGMENVFAYDAGILDWARANPDKAVLLGVTPMDPAKLLSKDKLKAHLISPAEFIERVKPGVAVLDLRDPSQSMGVSLFPGYQRNVPLSRMKALNRFLARTLDSGKTLLVYDNVGKQVRWFQYYLEDMGIPEYYMMEGGSKAFYEHLKLN